MRSTWASSSFHLHMQTASTSARSVRIAHSTSWHAECSRIRRPLNLIRPSCSQSPVLRLEEPHGHEVPHPSRFKTSRIRSVKELRPNPMETGILYKPNNCRPHYVGTRATIPAGMDARPVLRSFTTSTKSIQSSLTAMRIQARSLLAQLSNIGLTSQTVLFSSSGLNARLAAAGAKLNEVTGYGQIEGLKKQVADREEELHLSRSKAKLAKDDHALALAERMNSSVCMTLLVLLYLC